MLFFFYFFLQRTSFNARHVRQNAYRVTEKAGFAGRATRGAWLESKEARAMIGSQGRDQTLGSEPSGSNAETRDGKPDWSPTATSVYFNSEVDQRNN